MPRRHAGGALDAPLLGREYDPNDERQQAEREARAALHGSGDAAPMQALGMMRPGQDVRDAWRTYHTQQQSVNVLDTMIRNGTADPKLGYDLKLLRRDRKQAAAAAEVAGRVIDRLPVNKPSGIPD